MSQSPELHDGIVGMCERCGQEHDLTNGCSAFPEPSEVVGTCDVIIGEGHEPQGNEPHTELPSCKRFQPLDVDAARSTCWHSRIPHRHNEAGDCWDDRDDRIAALEAQLAADVPELEWARESSTWIAGGWLVWEYKPDDWSVNITSSIGEAFITSRPTLAAAQSLAARIQREIDREGDSK
jgi:hypothetical protein